VGSLMIGHQMTIQLNTGQRFASLCFLTTYDTGSYSYAHQRASWRLDTACAAVHCAQAGCC